MLNKLSYLYQDILSVIMISLTTLPSAINLIAENYATTRKVFFQRPQSFLINHPT